MVSKRLSAMAVSDFDPYSAGEGAVCSLLFGNSEEDSKEKTASVAPAPSKVCNDSCDKRFDSDALQSTGWSIRFYISCCLHQNESFVFV